MPVPVTEVFSKNARSVLKETKRKKNKDTQLSGLRKPITEPRFPLLFRHPREI